MTLRKREERGDLQEEALDRTVWGTGFRKGHGSAESQTTD
jgi:hypothetical protein